MTSESENVEKMSSSMLKKLTNSNETSTKYTSMCLNKNDADSHNLSYANLNHQQVLSKNSLSYNKTLQTVSITKSKKLSFNIDISSVSKALTKLSIQMNTSYHYLNNGIQLEHTKYVPLMVMLKDDSGFLRRLAVVPTEVKSSITSNFIAINNKRYIKSEKCGRGHIDVISKRKQNLYDECNEETVLHTLVWLQLSINRSFYPDCKAITDLVSEQILEVNIVFSIYDLLIKIKPSWLA